VHRVQSVRASGCELRKRTPSILRRRKLGHLIQREAVPADGGGAVVGANQPVSRPENASRPAMVASTSGNRVVRMEVLVTIVGLVASRYQGREEAARYSSGASCEAGVETMFVTKGRRRANLVIRLRSSHCAISLPPAVVTQGDIHEHVAQGSLETDHQRFGVFTALVAFVGREQ
jgi:hypothetical protein